MYYLSNSNLSKNNPNPKHSGINMSLAAGKRVVSSLSMSDQVVLGSSQNFSFQNIFEKVRYIPDILRDGLVTELTVK